jgi:hypothetical protein
LRLWQMHSPSAAKRRLRSISFDWYAIGARANRVPLSDGTL